MTVLWMTPMLVLLSSNQSHALFLEGRDKVMTYVFVTVQSERRSINDTILGHFLDNIYFRKGVIPKVSQIKTPSSQNATSHNIIMQHAQPRVYC